jgi:arginyl-tRNA--protein-N-Asp/Glu arginylyltransferase
MKAVAKIYSFWDDELKELSISKVNMAVEAIQQCQKETNLKLHGLCSR